MGEIISQSIRAAVSHVHMLGRVHFRFHVPRVYILGEFWSNHPVRIFGADYPPDHNTQDPIHYSI